MTCPGRPITLTMHPALFDSQLTTMGLVVTPSETHENVTMAVVDDVDKMETVNPGWDDGVFPVTVTEKLPAN